MKKREDFTIKSDAGIYIHIPFCKKKCSYCDFYSQKDFDWKNYLKALKAEIELYQEYAFKYNFSTLYIGGGTPSLVPTGGIEDLIDHLRQFDFLNNTKEISIEVNPESFTEEKAKEYKNANINRLSIGIQSFDDKILKKLGRLSDSKGNRRSVELAKKYFDNISLDLIYAVPGQNLEKELDNFFSFNSDHFSAYALTYVPETKLYEEMISLKLSDEEENRQFFKIDDKANTLGYTHYEISNYAKKGKESNHNLQYWKRNHYLGLGAGASGYLDNKRYKNHFILKYQNKLDEKNLPISEEELITKNDEILESFLLGLRMKKGFSAKNIKVPDSLLKLLKEFEKQGLVILKKNQIIPSLKGWCLLDAMLKKISEFI